MKRAVIEKCLQFAERQAAENQKDVLRHQGIVAKLESNGRRDSLTARAARALLETLQN
jgi:hypothetical protein